MVCPASERLAKPLNLTLGGIQVFFEDHCRMIQKRAPVQLIQVLVLEVIGHSHAKRATIQQKYMHLIRRYRGYFLGNEWTGSRHRESS
jgi:hypothetical protein